MDDFCLDGCLTRLKRTEAFFVPILQCPKCGTYWSYWFGTYHKIDHIKDNKRTEIPEINGLFWEKINCLLEDAKKNG